MAAGLLVQPIRRERLSRRIALEICRMIRRGQFEPGDLLPAERELAAQFEVSRNSVREALRGLEIAGIVETKHGGGSTVRCFSLFGTESPLAMVFEASHDNISDLWEVRRIIEPVLAERAAVRADPDAINWLGAMLDEHREQYLREQDHKSAAAFDREFHAGIARLTGNAVMEQVIQLVNSLVHRGYGAGPGRWRNRRRQAYERHLEILEAIRDREPARARSRMIEHLQEVEEYILSEIIDLRREKVEGGRTYRRGARAAFERRTPE